MANQKIDDILQKLSEHGIETFPVLTSLDYDCDIILEISTVDEFVRFCNSVGSRVAFYKVVYADLEDYTIDEDEFQETLVSAIEERLQDSCFLEGAELTIGDFSKEIQQAGKLVYQRNVNAKKEFLKIPSGEFLCAYIYVMYNGAQVGVVFENDCMQNFVFEEDVEEILNEFFKTEIEPKILTQELDEETRWQIFRQQAEEEHKQEQEQKRIIMMEIQRKIEEDPSIIEYTNGKQRHAYAKKLAVEYTEQHGISILIGDVEDIVTQRYRQLKSALKKEG